MFYFFEILAALSAISMLFIRNVFYGALLLLVCLLSLAAIYVLAFAEFIAVSQILIYAGGILVLIIFGIMITSRISGKPLVVSNNNVFAGLLAGISILSILIHFFSTTNFAATSQSSISTPKAVNNIGIGLMSDFVLPFEIAGVLLLISLIGAAVVTSFMNSKNT
jgi:NADH:ubiquinone oxidoreductase subunit 6 (subunit J)